MNTEYRRNPYARFGAAGTAGVDLGQLFITPSVAWKPTEAHSFGVGLNVAYQRFSAQGIGAFAGFSADPQRLSDRGTDGSLGAGVRVGWTGTVAPGVTLGATWASKVRGQFDDYRGLFADGGRFDVPENYGVGIAWRPKNLFKVFSGIALGAIGRSGCSGCAAWARAHASSRGVQSPDCTPTLRASALPARLRRCGAGP